MPRAAVLSIHARVERATPSSWEDPSLAQVWGPRYQVYAVAASDVPLFTLGRLPATGPKRRRAEELAERLEALLAGRSMRYDDAGRALGVDPNSLRYAALTGRFAVRWEGARRPTIWSVPAPEITPAEATVELARRFLHVFGPSRPQAFAKWAGVSALQAAQAFSSLEGELVPVATPVGDALLLARDEPELRAAPAPAAAVRLLPSGDAYTLHGTEEERALLVPDAAQRAELWTPRVWPGALLVGGEIVGTWRRSGRTFTISSWRRLTGNERDAVQGEAESLPLPDGGATVVHWN